MRLPEFEYHEPKTLKEASRTLIQGRKGCVLLAGGTDLLVRMKQRLSTPRKVLGLKSIPRLSSIYEGKEGIHIGAMTTLHALALSPLLNEKYPSLIQAVRKVGAYAHQIMGTLGGNLCQENRCRYYNQSVFWRSARAPCYKAGGKMCHVIKKSGKCYSAYCGDMAPVLIALEAQAAVTGPDGEKRLPLKRFYTGNGKKPLSLKMGEILKEIHIPPPQGKTVYLKSRRRDSIEFPVLSLALTMEVNPSGTIKKAKAVLSGAGPGPVIALRVERCLRGASLSGELILQASSLMTKEIAPMRTSTDSPSYKRKMAGILLRQGIMEIARS